MDLRTIKTHENGNALHGNQPAPNAMSKATIQKHVANVALVDNGGTGIATPSSARTKKEIMPIKLKITPLIMRTTIMPSKLRVRTFTPNLPRLPHAPIKTKQTAQKDQ